MYHLGTKLNRCTPMSILERLRDLTHRNWLSWRGFQFHVDVVSSLTISGWARNARKPSQRLLVEVREGDSILGQTLAGEFREDLLNASVGDGCYGFTIPLSISPVRNESVLVDIFVDGTKINTRAYTIKPSFDETFLDFSGQMEKRMDALLALHRERTERDIAEISKRLDG